jgi:hypothetical protein
MSYKAARIATVAFIAITLAGCSDSKKADQKNSSIDQKAAPEAAIQPQQYKFLGEKLLAIASKDKMTFPSASAIKDVLLECTFAKLNGKLDSYWSEQCAVKDAAFERARVGEKVTIITLSNLNSTSNRPELKAVEIRQTELHPDGGIDLFANLTGVTKKKLICQGKISEENSDGTTTNFYLVSKDNHPRIVIREKSNNIRVGGTSNTILIFGKLQEDCVFFEEVVNDFDGIVLPLTTNSVPAIATQGQVGSNPNASISKIPLFNLYDPSATINWVKIRDRAGPVPGTTETLYADPSRVIRLKPLEKGDFGKSDGTSNSVAVWILADSQQIGSSYSEQVIINCASRRYKIVGVQRYSGPMRSGQIVSTKSEYAGHFHKPVYEEFANQMLERESLPAHTADWEFACGGGATRALEANSLIAKKTIWSTLIAPTPDGIVYFDPSTIKRYGSFVKIWIMYSDKETSKKQHLLYNCGRKQYGYSLREEVKFNGPMASGHITYQPGPRDGSIDIIDTKTDPLELEAIMTHVVDGGDPKLWEAVCKQRT